MIVMQRVAKPVSMISGLASVHRDLSMRRCDEHPALPRGCPVGSPQAFRRDINHVAVRGSMSTVSRRAVSFGLPRFLRLRNLDMEKTAFSTTSLSWKQTTDPT